MIPYRHHILCATQWDRAWIIGTMIWSLFIFFHPFHCDYANCDKSVTWKKSQIIPFMTHFSTIFFKFFCWMSWIGLHMKVPNRFQHLFKTRCKISWSFLFIRGSKSIFIFLVSECSSKSICALEDLFSKNQYKIIFFVAYSPKMAWIGENGQKMVQAPHCLAFITLKKSLGIVPYTRG